MLKSNQSFISPAMFDLEKEAAVGGEGRSRDR